MTLIDKACFERGCACYDSRDKGECVEITEKREWVGLTYCEREKLRSEADEADAGYRKLIKATEAKLKEKNT